MQSIDADKRNIPIVSAGPRRHQISDCSPAKMRIEKRIDSAVEKSDFLQNR